jgi:hypothetical protein
MSKIVRQEFVGSWIYVFLLGITGVGIPVALIYAYCSAVRIETEMDNPEAFISTYRAGKLATK